MNILENTAEGRLRAGWRISFFIIGLIIFWIIASSLKSYLSGMSPGSFFVPVSYIITAGLLTLLVYITGITVDRRPLKSFGLHINSRWIKDLLAGAAIAGGVSVLLYGVGLALGWYDFGGFRFNRDGILFSFLGNIIIMASVAYYEELIFRGYLCLNIFEGCNKKGRNRLIPIMASILTVSLFFGFAHANNPNAVTPGIINIVLAGFMLSIPFFLTGSLAMVIGLHFAWNFVQGPVLGLPVSGIIFNNSLIYSSFSEHALINGSKFGMEGGLIGTAGILLIMLISWVYLRQRIPGFQTHPAIESQAILIAGRRGHNTER